MGKEPASLEGTIYFALLGLLLSVVAAGAADAFEFRGYTFNETNAVLSNTNVSIVVYQMGQGGPPTVVQTNYSSSNGTGYFSVNVSLANDTQYFYKPVIKHFNGTTLDYIGQSLPQFPHQMISQLTVGSPMNFYLRRGGTINLNATNETGVNKQFRYMIKDTRLGYPIAENFNAEVENVNNIYVPLERSYSIMIFPNQSLPISVDLNNLSTYPNNTANITFNTSMRLRRVTGYANLSNGSANFNNFTIITYLMEPGNMIGKDHPMPSNMSAFNRQNPESDMYNATNGSYNITLPGSAMGSGANIMLFAVANRSGTYYGAFRNITMNYEDSPVANFNFTLQPLLGAVENIAVMDAGRFGPPGSQNVNVTTPQLPFQLKNGSDPITGFAHIEVEVDYSTVYANGPNFKWMLDVQQADSGAFSFPAINASIKKINIFTQNFAPLKTSKNVSQLQSQPVSISLTTFRPGKPDESAFSDIMLDMLLSKSECDVPNPASGCSLMPDPTNGQEISEFDPFKVVMGGGKISMRIKKPSQRITVHYKNVDMLASGPPDALFDESASQSQSGSSVEQAWRFGSKGPEIYDEVLIGVPISSGISISGVKIGKLYDENWNSVWDSSAGNTSADRPSDYSGFNNAWFGSSGMSCSTSNASSECYIDSTNGTLWLRIPHFSGVGPTIVGTTSTSSSSSSGGGASLGSVSTTEPSSNIEKAERHDESLIFNKPVTYLFSASEHGITQVVITGKENENYIAVRVESLKGTSKNVAAPPPGTVYKNLNIIVGTKKIKEALVRFKVENTWLSSNSLAGSDVKLTKWDGSKWIMLETAEKSKDGTFTHFEAKTDSFSSFAIVALKTPDSQAEGATGSTAAGSQTGSTKNPAAPKENAPGFSIVLAVAMLSAVYLFKQKRR
ncbi:MAG: PGF-pre-PGF domain-containing protein [Candidatus Methanoperedens sp.]|nr:PGF-pre-PGF domain-containing protein [Candidatus Methanoperedens sp.]